MNGVDWGGSYEGSQSCRIGEDRFEKAGLEGELEGERRRKKSSCISDSEARWKCAGGLSCKTIFFPLRDHFEMSWSRIARVTNRWAYAERPKKPSNL